MRYEHDRYAIYKLKGREIEAFVPRTLGGYHMKGIVHKVERDCMEEVIRMSVGRHLYMVEEPDLMNWVDGDLYFIFGDLEAFDSNKDEDDELFDELREISPTGGTLRDALENTSVGTVRFIHFKVNAGD